MLNSRAARVDEVHPELTAAVGDLGSVAQDNKAPDIWVVEKRAAQVDEVNPEQTAAVGDLGSAAPDDKAPNIWVVEKRAAQQSDSGKIWVVE